MATSALTQLLNYVKEIALTTGLSAGYVFLTYGCLQKRGAAGKECKCEEGLIDRCRFDER